MSEAYTLQNNTKIDGQNISAEWLVIKAKYLCSMQYNTNCYWEKQPLQQTTIVPTCAIIHPHLDVVGITYVQCIPKNVCDRIKLKNPYKDILFV